jgi:hypothetical protein
MEMGGWRRRKNTKSKWKEEAHDKTKEDGCRIAGRKKGVEENSEE